MGRALVEVPVPGNLADLLDRGTFGMRDEPNPKVRQWQRAELIGQQCAAACLHPVARQPAQINARRMFHVKHCVQIRNFEQCNAVSICG